MDFVIFNWVVGSLGTLVALVGLFYIFSSIRKMDGDLRKAMIFLAIAILFLVVFGTFSGIIFTIYENPASKWFWLPIMFLISMIFLTLGSKKLLGVLTHSQDIKK